MENYLKKYKKENKIDYINIPLNYGRINKEFLVYSFLTKKFSRIFYDNKYREDTFNPDNVIKNLEVDIDRVSGDIETIGIYNTRKEYNEYTRQLEFIKKYINK